MSKEDYLGYLKYTGESVDGGIFDARKSAEALIGFDEIMHFFIIEDNPELKNVNFEIPVLIEKGSWSITIPEIIEKLLTLKGAGGTFLLTYGTTTAAEAAKKGLFNTGLAKDIKTIYKGGLISAQWVIKIAKHIGSFSKRRYDNAKIKRIEDKVFIDIPNSNGDLLQVPKKYFDYYNNCPEKLFSKNAKLIEEGRPLQIGIMQNGVEETINIAASEKGIFYKQEDDNEVLFPELKHGQEVELEGEITRGNEKTNTIGFEYKGHVITCLPSTGHIAIFKAKIISRHDDQFFPPVKLIGHVDRMDKDSLFIEKRPRIIFEDIIPLDQENATKLNLFKDEELG